MELVYGDSRLPFANFLTGNSSITSHSPFISHSFRRRMKPAPAWIPAFAGTITGSSHDGSISSSVGIPTNRFPCSTRSFHLHLEEGKREIGQLTWLGTVIPQAILHCVFRLPFRIAPQGGSTTEEGARGLCPLSEGDHSSGLDFRFLNPR